MIVHPEVAALADRLTRDVFLNLMHVLPDDPHLLQVGVLLSFSPLGKLDFARIVISILLLLGRGLLLPFALAATEVVIIVVVIIVATLTLRLMTAVRLHRICILIEGRDLGAGTLRP